MKRGRKPQKFALAWKLFRRHKVAEPDGSWRVNSPLVLLHGAMSYQYACTMLTKLESAGYIRKVTLGGLRIEYVIMLKDVEELGEDVLGKNDDSGKQSTAAHRQIPSVPTPAPGALAPMRAPAMAQHQRHGVIILADYDNSAIPLKAAGSEFPAEGLLEFARGKGSVLAARVFIPLNVAREDRLFLRRSGWRIMECPPLKDGGGDTVDKTIEEEMQLLIRISSVGTFIIVSRDADFQDACRVAENHGRKCIVVSYNPSSAEMRSQDGEAIRLSVQPQVINGRNGMHRKGFDANKFFDIVQGIESGTVAYDPADLMHRFIMAIVEVLEARSAELENPKTRKHFMGLSESLWTDVRRNFSDLSRDELKELLTALKNSAVLQKNWDGQLAYYTFDTQCSFVRTLRHLQILV